MNQNNIIRIMITSVTHQMCSCFNFFQFEFDSNSIILRTVRMNKFILEKNLKYGILA